MEKLNHSSSNGAQHMDDAPTRFEEIIKKVQAYHEKMNAIADFLEEKGAPQSIRIDRSKEYLEFYIDKPSLARLKEMSELPDCDTLTVFLALADYDGHHGITGCILAVDANKQIVKDHFSELTTRPGRVPFAGEDTWLPPGSVNPRAAVYNAGPKDFTLRTSKQNILAHFTR